MKKPIEAEHEMISRVLMGNGDAIRMANELFFISQVWDDLVDKDKPVDAATINRMMWVALVDLPLNPFYQLNFCALHPIIRASIIDWMVATDFENKIGLEDELPVDPSVPYVLRDSISAILCHMAYLVGGYDWMVQVSPEIRAWVHDEAMTDYVRKIVDRNRKRGVGRGKSD
ncbi:MAG TPA: hypothetical protein PKI80_09545 [Deltaproteobacteria bacterium]|nr:hypothetical protein [Deltaproteobacteria bacterium]